MPWELPSTGFTVDHTTFAPVDGGRPGEFTCSLWPELTLLQLPSWDVLSRCYGICGVFEPVGGGAGHAFFLAGQVFRNAVRTGLWSAGLKVYPPKVRFTENYRYFAPSESGPQPLPAYMASSPPGTIRSVGLLLANDIDETEAGHFRLPPLNWRYRIFGLITKASGSGVSRTARESAPGNDTFAGCHGLAETRWTGAGPSNGWLAWNSVNWGTYGPYISTFSVNMPSINCAYAALAHRLQFGSLKDLLTAGRAGYIAKALEAGEEAAEVLAQAYGEVLTATADRAVDFGIPLMSVGGAPLATPGEQWRRELNTERVTPENAFVPRPAMPPEDVAGWETATTARIAAYGDTGAAAMCAAAPTLPADGILTGYWGYNTNTQRYGESESQINYTVSELVTLRNFVMGGASIPVGAALVGYFPGWEIRHPLTPGEEDVDLDFTLSDVRPPGSGAAPAASDLGDDAELSDQKAELTSAAIEVPSVASAYGSLLPAIITFAGAVEKRASELLEED